MVYHTFLDTNLLTAHIGKVSFTDMGLPFTDYDNTEEFPK
jgi:hypothetical protein